MHRSAIKKKFGTQCKPWSGLVRPTVPVLAAQAVLLWWGTGAGCTVF